MKLQVKSGGVPAGSYIGRFVGVEPTETKIGKALRWTWEVLSGPHAGAKASRITPPEPTTRNACGRILSAVTGKGLVAGEEHDPHAFVGRTYLLVVAECDGGGCRVETVTLPPVSLPTTA